MGDNFIADLVLRFAAGDENAKDALADILYFCPGGIDYDDLDMLAMVAVGLYRRRRGPKIPEQVMRRAEWAARKRANRTGHSLRSVVPMVARRFGVSAKTLQERMDHRSELVARFMVEHPSHH